MARLHFFPYNVFQHTGDPKRIRVYEASALLKKKQKMIADVTEVKLVDGWIEIPLAWTVPRDCIMIEIDRSERQFVLLDEIEFKRYAGQTGTPKK